MRSWSSVSRCGRDIEGGCADGLEEQHWVNGKDVLTSSVDLYCGRAS